MNVFQSMLLGLIQGLTEFLPVSSSGHLIIARNLLDLNLEDHLLFDTLLHIGTLVSVLIVYGPDVWELITEFFGSIGPFFRGELKWKKAYVTDETIEQTDGKKKVYTSKTQRFIVLLVCSLLPLFLILPFQDVVEKEFSSPLIVGCALIFTAIFLFISDRITSGNKTAENMTIKDAFMIGFIQLVAVLPGISRSGSTITAGLACGLKRKFAAKFSFIMSIPTIVAAFGLNVLDLIKVGEIDTSLIPVYLCGMLVATISGFFAIRLLQYLLSSKKFIWFSIYCLGMGLFCIIGSLI